MNNVYIEINGVDYIIPVSVIGTNSDLFREYTKRNNDRLYLDIDRLVEEGKNMELFKIYQHCVKSLSMNALAIDGDYIDRINKLESLFKSYDNMIRSSFRKNDFQKGNKYIFLGLETALEFYNNMINDEVDNVKTK